MSRVSCHAELAATLDGATLVQENGPENPEIKQGIFGDFESLSGADTLLVFSTSCPYQKLHTH
jgi:3-hydroxyacyl-CoA dehydrogenase